MFFDRNIDFLTGRETINFTAQALSIENEPSRSSFGSQGFSHTFEVFFTTAVFHNADNVAGFYQSGSDIKTFAVNSDMTMSYLLTSLATAIGQAKTVNYIVHSSFQKNEQVFTCNTFLFFGFNEGIMELTF